MLPSAAIFLMVYFFLQTRFSEIVIATKFEEISLLVYRFLQDVVSFSENLKFTFVVLFFCKKAVKYRIPFQKRIPPNVQASFAFATVKKTSLFSSVQLMKFSSPWATNEF